MLTFVPSALRRRNYLDKYLSSALNVPLENNRLSAIDEKKYVLTLDYTLKVRKVFPFSLSVKFWYPLLHAVFIRCWRSMNVSSVVFPLLLKVKLELERLLYWKCCQSCGTNLSSLNRGS